MVLGLIYICVRIYENGPKRLISRTKRAFPRQKLSPKGTILKLKGKSVYFSFFYPFIFLSLPPFLYFFVRLHSLEAA